MKINLNTQLRSNAQGTETIQLGDVIANALFKSQLSNARQLYDKVAGKEQAELTVKELSDIQQAIEPIYIAGIKWQVDDIFNQKEKK